MAQYIYRSWSVNKRTECIVKHTIWWDYCPPSRFKLALRNQVQEDSWGNRRMLEDLSQEPALSPLSVSKNDTFEESQDHL